MYTRPYVRATKKLFSSSDHLRVDRILSADPTIGDIIPGVHGVRKMRLALDGKGKRGGARVIYYFCQSDLEVFLMFAYAKNQQSDLTSEQKKAAIELVRMIQGGDYEG